MGIEITADIEEEFFENLPPLIGLAKLGPLAQLLRQTREMSSSDLKVFFEILFSRMTFSSKEAVTEIMWTGLTSSEQETFELPYYGHR
jgi:hypothetical protein